MVELSFTKMHGLGNCFILMDDRDGSISGAKYDLPELTRAVCDRNFGIGADGLILVRNCDGMDFEMRIINEDGSEAEMCGNGIRCMAKFVVDEGMIDVVGAQNDKPSDKRQPMRIDTLAGIIETRMLEDGRVEVDMGEPILNNDDVVGDGVGPIVVKEEGFEFIYVSMGNPHAIAFVDDLDFDWRAVGARVEVSKAFPKRTNVEFVKVVGPSEAIMKVWERGCGETMACGTGACAVAVAGVLTECLPRELVKIHLPGGPLDILWNERGKVMMTGPTITVCKGIYEY